MFAFIKLYEISWLIWKYNRHYSVYDTICYKFCFSFILADRHKSTIPANIKKVISEQIE